MGQITVGRYRILYCATKAFVLSFSEAIAEELQGTGISVTTLCPGATKTEFSGKAHMEDTKLFKKGVMDAKTVAEIGYQAMVKGDRLVVAGFGNKLQILLMKFMPRKMMTKMVKDAMSVDIKSNSGMK